MGKSPNGNLKEFIDINRIKAEQLLRKHGEYLDGDLLEELCENLERFWSICSTWSPLEMNKCMKINKNFVNFWRNKEDWGTFLDTK